MGPLLLAHLGNITHGPKPISMTPLPPWPRYIAASSANSSLSDPCEMSQIQPSTAEVLGLVLMSAFFGKNYSSYLEPHGQYPDLKYSGVYFVLLLTSMHLRSGSKSHGRRGRLAARTAVLVGNILLFITIVAVSDLTIA